MQFIKVTMKDEDIEASSEFLGASDNAPLKKLVSELKDFMEDYANGESFMDRFFDYGDNLHFIDRESEQEFYDVQKERPELTKDYILFIRECYDGYSPLHVIDSFAKLHPEYEIVSGMKGCIAAEVVLDGNAAETEIYAE